MKYSKLCQAAAGAAPVAAARVLFLAGARQPERAEGAEAVEVLGDRQKTPRCLTGGEDLVEPVEGLVPQIICL
ncbi:hypothetical protein C2S51_026234 [Perilla frutescens var. frutescens]|nr:hypothetical protein C2S51_026234 [Perilla frutescens var. frutescens]